MDGISELPSKVIDCIVTSPPYWALRDYGVDGEIGSEATYDAYVTNLCYVFGIAKRILKDSGSIWVNMCDSYPKKKTEVPDKSLMGIPFRFAVAMISRGWTLRNVIIWHKPNAIPSSKKDRFTIDYEYFFWFTKKDQYYFEQQFEEMKTGQWDAMPPIGEKKHVESESNFNTTYSGNTPPSNPEGRNKRCVWSINTQKAKDMHFAVYPEELIKIPIKSSCPEGGIVLDPFLGSGTTLKVCRDLGRIGLGFDINPDYADIIEDKSEERLYRETIDIDEFF
jgi:site-specific DNA-methyltransferase (adenine-specific)